MRTKPFLMRARVGTTTDRGQRHLKEVSHEGLDLLVMTVTGHGGGGIRTFKEISRMRSDTTDIYLTLTIEPKLWMRSHA
jgi:hypothetical protein